MSGGGTDWWGPYSDLMGSVQLAADYQSTAAKQAGEAYKESTLKGLGMLEKQTDTIVKEQQGIASQISQIATNLAKEQSNAVTADLAPFREAGIKGMGLLQDYLGLSGPEAQQAALSGLLQGPQTQAQLKLGVEALDRSQAAKGTTRTGRALSELFTLGQDIAATRISDTQNQLLGLTNVGLSAAQTMAQSRASQQLAAAQLQSQGLLSTGSTIANARSNLGASQLSAYSSIGEQQGNALLASAQAQAQAATRIGQINFLGWENYGQYGI